MVGACWTFHVRAIPRVADGRLSVRVVLAWVRWLAVRCHTKKLERRKLFTAGWIHTAFLRDGISRRRAHAVLAGAD